MTVNKRPARPSISKSKPTTLEVPQRMHMKKQVSFDYRSSEPGEPDNTCSSISNEGLAFIQKMNIANHATEKPLRSYQRDLIEFYQEKKHSYPGAKGSIPDVPILATLEVIPPKPGNSRLSRKDKQSGWNLPDPSRSSSRTARAVERFLVNLTRPTDQRNQPIPKKPPKMSDPVPSGNTGTTSNKGKMKVLNGIYASKERLQFFVDWDENEVWQAVLQIWLLY